MFRKFSCIDSVNAYAVTCILTKQKSCISVRTAVAPNYGTAGCSVLLLHTPQQKQSEMPRHVNYSTGAVECKVECIASSVLLVCFCVIYVVLHLYPVVCVGLYCDITRMCVHITIYHKLSRLKRKGRRKLLPVSVSWLRGCLLNWRMYAGPFVVSRPRCSRDRWLFCITCDIVVQPIGCWAIQSPFF